LTLGYCTVFYSAHHQKIKTGIKIIKHLMYYVYLIKSIKFPQIMYVGYTTDLEQRLATHNSGGAIHTNKYKPWQLIMHLTFTDQIKAKEFEQYLKSQSGRAFAKKRLW
jgi:putative endonuclease